MIRQEKIDSSVSEKVDHDTGGQSANFDTERDARSGVKQPKVSTPTRYGHLGKGHELNRILNLVSAVVFGIGTI